MQGMLNSHRAWIRLIRTPGFGARSCTELLQIFGSAEAICAASVTQLKAAGLNSRAAEALQTVDETIIDQDIGWLQEEDSNHLLTITDTRYPDLLRQIPDPPAWLFLKGDPDLIRYPQLAIVGSRNPTRGGIDNAREFARHLATLGLGITSGLASGIDAAAHEGALAAQGITLAVVATGLDRVYPASNRELAHRIAETGLLVSEFPPGTLPKPGHFPSRNRIISGLSIGVLVTEAAEKSGSLITARLASEQGREVFAIPGSIHNPMARGCHRLIRQGAKLVEKAEDILEELAPYLREIPKTVENPAANPNLPEEGPDEDYRKLLAVLAYDPLSIDEIIQQSGLTAEQVSSMLLLLELQGHVESLSGNRFCRIASSPSI
jgi:DNA processing protein